MKYVYLFLVALIALSACKKESPSESLVLAGKSYISNFDRYSNGEFRQQTLDFSEDTVLVHEYYTSPEGLKEGVPGKWKYSIKKSGDYFRVSFGYGYTFRELTYFPGQHGQKGELSDLKGYIYKEVIK